MAKKILIVTKDRMEFNIFSPVAAELERHGCEVVVVAEGLSMEMWSATRLIYGGVASAEHLDPNTKIRNDINPEDAIRQIKPDVVMTGLGAPIHLGEKFGQVANYHMIPVIEVEDLWGVHARSKAQPHLICTIDHYGKSLIEQTYAGKEKRPAIAVTGCPADDSLKSVKVHQRTDDQIKAAGALRVILIAGQDESTTPMLEGMRELANSTPNTLVFLPRLHPKIVKDPSKKSMVDYWMNLLGEISRRQIVISTDENVDTRSLMLSATEIVSIYSNALREAVLLERIAVSWISPVGIEKTKAALWGLERFPLVSLGAVIPVSGAKQYFTDVPCAVTESGRHRRQLLAGKNITRADGQSTARVAAEVLDRL